MPRTVNPVLEEISLVAFLDHRWGSEWQGRHPGILRRDDFPQFADELIGRLGYGDHDHVLKSCGASGGAAPRI